MPTATGNAIQSAYTGSIGQVLNPSNDTTGAKDSAAITAALAAGPVYFGAGIFYVNATIQIPSYAVMIGAGELPQAQGTVLRMAAGANLAAVAASTGWTTSANTSVLNPCIIRGICFDANQSAQSSGAGHALVLQTFRAVVEDCQFINTLGDGLRFDQRGANGTTAISNTGIENQVLICQFRNIGAIGLHVNDPTFNSFTDGFVLNCIVQTAAAQGMKIDAGAGWVVQGCHLYGIQFSGILVGRAFATRIAGNYVEDWGVSSTLGSYAAYDLANIFMNDGGTGSSITGNNCNLNAAPGNASSSLSGVALEAATGDVGTVSVTGNVLDASDNTFPANYSAVVLVCQSGSATLNVTLAGNQYAGNWGGGTVQQIPNGGAINLNQFDSTNMLVSNAGQPAATIQTSGNAAFVTAFNVLAPQLSALTRDVLFNLGVSTTTKNACTWAFEYQGVGSNANNMKFNFFGSAVFFSITAAGIVSTLDNTLDDGTGNMTVAGNLDISTAGKGLQVKEGSNAKQGTAVLNGTTNVVVSNTSVTANSRIFLTHQSNSGVPGVPYVTARTAGTSFTVVSTAASDLGTVAYEIFEPG